MKISVITVCLNAEKCIEKTFLSVINQTYKDWELVVIDGDSSDGTLGIIEKYKDNIAFFESKKDSGIYDAMNKAIKHASGDYFIFLNAGDTLYDDNVFENAVKKIQMDNLPDLAFGYTHYCDSKKIEKFEHWQRKYYFSYKCFCHQGIFYKKDLFQNDCYDTSYVIHADWDFNVRCALDNTHSICELGFCVSNYDLGGFSSKKENLSVIRREKALIQKKYFKEIYPLLWLDTFLTKYFNSIYKYIRKLAVGED